MTHIQASERMPIGNTAVLHKTEKTAMVAQPLELFLDQERQFITLRGDLEDNGQIREQLNVSLSTASNLHETWAVDASQVRIVPEGVELWSSCVLEHLSNCTLAYLPSQLAMVLEYDESYSHKHTRFIPSDAKAW